MSATHITRLALTDFRSYRWLELTPGAGSVALLGPNGAGKTNILEAISLLGPGRGLRRAEVSTLKTINGSGTGWGVVGTVQQGSGQHQLATARASSDDGTDKRTAQIDGNNASLSALGDFLPLSWLTPDMDRLLGAERGDKRRFFDRLVSSFDPAHTGRLARYDKLARERLQILINGPQDEAWLATLESDMAEAAVAIAAGRLALAGALNERAPAIAGQFPVVRIAFAEGPEAWLAHDPSLVIEERLKDAFRASRPRDRRTETTEAGPARSDFTAFYVAKNMPADLCSTGEQKALLITLLMAHAALVAEMRGVTPVLLLDEVASHLDAGRRQALYGTLHALGCQVWMTGTEIDLFRPFPGPLTCYEIGPGNARIVSK